MTLNLVSLLIVGVFGGLLGGGVMLWMTRNWRAAAIVACAALATAMLWLLQGIFE